MDDTHGEERAVTETSGASESGPDRVPGSPDVATGSDDIAATHDEALRLQRELEETNSNASAVRADLRSTSERTATVEKELDRRVEPFRTKRQAADSSGLRAVPHRLYGAARKYSGDQLRMRSMRWRRNPLFDDGAYLEMYPDVAVSRVDPYRHYRQHGAREGRKPNPFFDRAWYLRNYPDVAASGVDPIDDYHVRGVRDGRDPSPDFHSACYLADNPDVLASGMNPLLHYQRYGLREDRPLCDLWHGDAGGLTPRERYGNLYDSALDARSEKADVVWFGVIEWEFRVQRPQHLASEMADAGHRVIYVSAEIDPTKDEGHSRSCRTRDPGVFQIRLKLSSPTPSLYTGLHGRHRAQAIAAIRECATALSLRYPISVVQFPAWRSVAMSLPGATVVMDCLDHVAGFSNVSPEVVAEEAQLTSQADVVIASSQRLADTLSETRPAIVVRNGAETDFFAKRPTEEPFKKKKPIVGYFGAMVEWFETDWIVHAARERHDWDFVLIGKANDLGTDHLDQLDNVHLLGERPYADLPAYLHQFDTAVIPFKLTELVRNVNPVKVYEYLSAGVPVVASALPELQGLRGLVYIANDASDFVQQIDRAIREDDDERRQVRQRWASQHDWASRGRAFRDAIDRAFVRVSVIVLCYNNWSETQACLKSLLTLSDYPPDLLEIIVVDNASSDGTADGLEEFRRRDSRVDVVRNSENLGFAGGNNVGIGRATGDVVILLNNDTHVTRGWICRLIRPLLRDDQVGMSGPLTNNIGNEQKTTLTYDTMEQMLQLSSRFTDGRLGEVYETDSLAFFCVALRRDVIDDVGLLDEDFGVGFFEDDDYCRRAAQRGWRMVIVDDVFVHHQLQASFDLLGTEARGRLFERNKRIYETKWGPYRPHQYRDAPGFGE